MKKKQEAAKKQNKVAKNKAAEKSGLSFQEKKQLRDLKKALAGTDKDTKTPDTAQKTITFEKMYKDGICKVSDKHYTKMVEFYDINYDLLEIEDQGTILEEYSKLINYFDPSIKFQLFLFNRQVSAKELAAQLNIALQGDAFDDIREEYSQMLKKQAAKGTNGIIKSKYIIFGVDALNVKDARATLMNIEKDVIRNLNGMGTNAHSLDGKERLRVLHEYFNQGALEPFRFSFKELSESGKSVKDYVAPPGFDFRFPNRFRSGKMYGCVHYLDIIAPRFNDELLKRLLDIDDNLTVTMHMQTMDPVKAIKMLKGALTNIQKMKIEEQKKAVRSGYDMDILPTDIITYEKDTLELLDDLNSSNQKIIKMTFLITCFGKTKKDLEAITQRVSGIIQQANCNLRPLQYLQEQGLMASAPIGCNETGIERVLTTKSTAILVPFCTQELFMQAPAIYYGLNALSNNMIMADRKKLRTPNGVILGTPGSGKSFSAKREILSCFLMTRDDVVICDPEGEYFPLVQALNGQVVRLATNSKDYLNPMDIQISHKDDKEALKLKSDFLITLCDLIAGGKDGLENDEKGIIDECIRHIYDKYFDNPIPENMPLLEDLYDALLAHKNPKAERIANSLVLYVHGSQNYFNHRTNVDSQNRIMCFDIRDLGNQLKELGMLIVQDAVWNRVSMNRERKIATRYYCDEFHLLLREKQTAIYSVEIWKRFRKWGGIPTGLTQNVGDFLRSEEIEGILGNSDFVYLLNQNAKDQNILADKLGLSAKQLQHVTNSDPGSGLILFDNVVIPFVDKYPTDTKTYRIMNTKPEESVKQGEA
ncbi:MAG: conjugal transfer protein TraE [Bacilli bacterium]|nr:conjugal transfer protein TraE [Bacilli bacterium]